MFITYHCVPWQLYFIKKRTAALKGFALERELLNRFKCPLVNMPYSNILFFLMYFVPIGMNCERHINKIISGKHEQMT